MKNINFIKTNDGSVGLYDTNLNEIFHSKTGAKTEALQKFIFPVIDYINKEKEINILDICYGIGYNTKAALDNFKKQKINIDVLEYNKKLVLISPFINDGFCNPDLKNFLINKIFINEDDIICLIEALNDINKSEIKDVFSGELNAFLRLIKLNLDNNPHNYIKNSNLHNIYYNYISNKNKYDLKSNKYENHKINFHIGDARAKICELKYNYDVIFLDAFSPQKDPTLWTIDFLSMIKEKMNYNSVILSYSKSTPFRSALKDLNLFVGKNYIDNIDMGTIASLNKDLIKNPLNDFDLQLLNTKSGITYKDSSLTLSSSEIIKNRENEQNLSSRISHTAFLKNYKK